MIIKKLTEQKQIYEHFLGQGKALDYEDYKYTVGIINGLDRAIGIIQDNLIEKQDEHN